MAELTTLFRPVGRRELDLICAGGFREFPPRLKGQPFFYPVITEEYANQIARDWNTKDELSGFRGYVLRFQIRTDFLEKFQIHVVGDAHHAEYWIPAADLQLFNEHIVGTIEVLREFAGDH
jgi:hypothetical protein